eukprot:TRINITY_DN2347_c0_g1_i1.p1 TRINITY_DN2347_c0_g1~~TRINITY_DN2347_c0_g1_i1.p1  ORF type:complete len:1829 (-),score=374.67 TRINITY_DN2347_c0_g1_i1:39-5525(-)
MLLCCIDGCNHPIAEDPKISYKQLKNVYRISIAARGHSNTYVCMDHYRRDPVQNRRPPSPPKLISRSHSISDERASKKKREKQISSSSSSSESESDSNEERDDDDDGDQNDDGEVREWDEDTKEEESSDEERSSVSVRPGPSRRGGRRRRSKGRSGGGSEVRRSTRAIKRPRQYSEDELIMTAIEKSLRTHKGEMAEYKKGSHEHSFSPSPPPTTSSSTSTHTLPIAPDARSHSSYSAPAGRRRREAPLAIIASSSGGSPPRAYSPSPPGSTAGRKPRLATREDGEVEVEIDGWGDIDMVLMNDEDDGLYGDVLESDTESKQDKGAAKETHGHEVELSSESDREGGPDTESSGGEEEPVRKSPPKVDAPPSREDSAVVVGKRCWYGACNKADRSIKLMRPFIMPACKTHATKAETRLCAAIVKGQICLQEGETNAAGAVVKDRACGVCMNMYSPAEDVNPCSRPDCAFAFCARCSTLVASKFGNPYTTNKEWTCWVCMALKSRSPKLRERPQYVSTLHKEIQTQNEQKEANKLASAAAKADTPPAATKAPKAKAKDTDTPKTAKEKENKDKGKEKATVPEKTFVPGEDARRSVRTGRGKRKDPVSSGAYDPSLPYMPLSSNNNNNLNIAGSRSAPVIEGKTATVAVIPQMRSDSLEVLLDNLIYSLRYFDKDPAIANEVHDRITRLHEIAVQLRLTRWAQGPHDELWEGVRSLGALVGRNLIATQQISKVHQQLENMPAPIPRQQDDSSSSSSSSSDTLMARQEIDQQLKHAVSKSVEFNSITYEIHARAVQVVDSIHRSRTLAHVRLSEVNRELDARTSRLINLEQTLPRHMTEVDIELAHVQNEIGQLRDTESRLVDELQRVQGLLARAEALQRTLLKKSDEYKMEMDHSIMEVNKVKLRLQRQQGVYEAEDKALDMLRVLVEDTYYIMHSYYSRVWPSYVALVQNKVLQHCADEYVAPTWLVPATPGEGETKAGSSRADTIAIYHPMCLEHSVPSKHLERPERLRVAIQVIHETQKTCPGQLDIFTDPPEVDNRYVLMVHDAQYIKHLRDTAPSVAAHQEGYTQLAVGTAPSSCTAEDTKLVKVPAGVLYDTPSDATILRTVPSEAAHDVDLLDTFLSPLTLQAAYRSAGAVCEAVDLVLKGGYKRAFCAVRPPGHHAGRYGKTANAPTQGYCILNNVAIGGKYAMLTGGLDRIAVVDFDVHHGNGTEEILAADDSFLFASMHVCEDRGFFFPGTGFEDGTAHGPRRGEGRGLTSSTAIMAQQNDAFTTGSNTPAPLPSLPTQPQSSDHRGGTNTPSNVLNIALRRHTGSAGFMAAVRERLLPRLSEFKPQLIILSAGFDGHKDDPANGLKLTEEDYYALTKMMMSVADKYSSGRIISVLEGGYGVVDQPEKGKSASLRRCVTEHLRALAEGSDLPAPGTSHPPVASSTSEAEPSPAQRTWKFRPAPPPPPLAVRQLKYDDPKMMRSSRGPGPGPDEMDTEDRKRTGATHSAAIDVDKLEGEAHGGPMPGAPISHPPSQLSSMGMGPSGPPSSFANSSAFSTPRPSYGQPHSMGGPPRFPPAPGSIPPNGMGPSPRYHSHGPMPYPPNHSGSRNYPPYPHPPHSRYMPSTPGQGPYQSPPPMQGRSSHHQDQYYRPPPPPDVWSKQGSPMGGSGSVGAMPRKGTPSSVPSYGSPMPRPRPGNSQVLPAPRPSGPHGPHPSSHSGPIPAGPPYPSHTLAPISSGEGGMSPMTEARHPLAGGESPRDHTHSPSTLPPPSAPNLPPLPSSSPSSGPTPHTLAPLHPQLSTSGPHIDITLKPLAQVPEGTSEDRDTDDALPNTILLTPS